MQQQPGGFKDLLNAMMKRRWFITAIVLGGFMLIMGGIFASIMVKAEIAGEWKELLLLLLGAFIGSYGKIVDYWFSDTDKDKMLVQKMDEEDGVTLSNTADMPVNNQPVTPIIPEAFTAAINDNKSINETYTTTKEETIADQFTIGLTETAKKGVEIDEDNDGVMDGLDFDGDGKIDEYFTHRQCEHVWGDSDGDGDLECLKCGKIKDPDPDEDLG